MFAHQLVRNYMYISLHRHILFVHLFIELMPPIPINSVPIGFHCVYPIVSLFHLFVELIHHIWEYEHTYFRIMENYVN